MYKEKIGLYQIRNIFAGLYLFNVLLICIGFLHNNFAIIICALTVIVFLILFGKKICKEDGVLYVNSRRNIIMYHFQEMANSYEFHSDIYDMHTDNPYFMITDSRMRTDKIFVCRQGSKWYLVKERI